MGGECESSGGWRALNARLKDSMLSSADHKGPNLEVVVEMLWLR